MDNDDSDNDNEARPSTSAVSTPERVIQAPAHDVSTPEPLSKRSRSAGRGTFVVKQEPRRSSRRSLSEPRESVNQAEKTFILNKGINNTTVVSSMTPPGSPVQLKNKANTLRSPMIKAPPAHL